MPLTLAALNQAQTGTLIVVAIIILCALLINDLTDNDGPGPMVAI